MSKSAAQILREAAEVIEERGKLRDTEGGERSMSRAVAAYNALCGPSMEGELQGWLFMCCLKLARATAGSTHIDDYTDLCGYAALAAECVSKGEKTPKNGWIEWEGGECPVDPETKVIVKLRDGGALSHRRAGGWSWGHYDSPADIVAYKVVDE